MTCGDRARVRASIAAPHLLPVPPSPYIADRPLDGTGWTYRGYRRITVPVDLLTEDDQRKHVKAIARIRARIFRRHSMADYGMLENTEEVVPPHATERLELHSGKHVRILMLGGLRYELRAARPTRWWIEARHCEGKKFIIFAGWNDRGEDRAQFTRFAIDVEFDALDRKLLQATQDIRRQGQPIPPMKRHRA